MLTHNLKNKISNLLRKSMKGGMRGFTLLELVIVIAIIGILAVIVLPSMLSALSKARDAKKMSELRGIQSFLTVSGIDTSLRYPKDTTELKLWYGYRKERGPVALTQTAPEYRYAGIGCDTTAGAVRVGSGTSDATTCQSYQLWTELEIDAAALRLDADLIGAAAGTACSGTGTGPCVNTGDIDGSIVIPTGGKEGNLEACTNRAATTANTTADCVFDLVP